MARVYRSGLSDCCVNQNVPNIRSSGSSIFSRFIVDEGVQTGGGSVVDQSALIEQEPRLSGIGTGPLIVSGSRNCGAWNFQIMIASPNTRVSSLQ